MAQTISHEVIDQIIFGMENQEQQFMFDLDSCEVVTVDIDSDDENENKAYVDLPDWNSSMGFQLMEKFVANLRNPIYRELLRESLAGGKGVFRRFKNVLKERPEIEQLWFQFKEREMKHYVLEWFEAVQEARQLEEVQVEEEETEELVLSDFSIFYAEESNISEYVGYDRQAFFDNYPGLPPEIISEYYTSVREGTAVQPTDVLRAETPNEDLAGFVWLFEHTGEGGTSESGPLYLRILQLYVLPEYRGLGLARTLLEHIMEDACRRGIEWLFVEAYGEAIGFGDTLVAGGFKRHAVGLALDLHRWGLDNLYS